MIPTLEKTNYDALKKQKDDLINNIAKNFDDLDPDGRKTWGTISEKLFPAVRELFSSLIDTMEKNEKALFETIEKQRQASTQQALNSQ